MNGQSFEHVNHAKALEILRSSTHLSITVKSNLLGKCFADIVRRLNVGIIFERSIVYPAFKEMLQMPDNSPRPRGRANKPEIPRLQSDPRARLSTHVDPITPVNPLNPLVGGVHLLIADSNVSPCKDAKKEHKGFMTLGPKRRLQKALMKMNILPKNTIKLVL